MTEPAEVRAALRVIPGWQQATWTALRGGLTNHSILLTSDNDKAVLKIDTAPRTPPFNSRLEEARIQNLANAVGIAPPVLYVSETLILTRYVEGEVFRSTIFNDDWRLAQLAAALRQLHALPLAGRTFDAQQSAQLYMRQLADRDVDTSLAECHLARILRMPAPENLCCCHNDLVAANLLATDRVLFLDWEYACNNDPLFDLATVIAHNQLDPGQAQYLLDQYFAGDAKRWRPQIERQSRLYESLTWLWEASQ